MRHQEHGNMQEVSDHPLHSGSVDDFFLFSIIGPEQDIDFLYRRPPSVEQAKRDQMESFKPVRRSTLEERPAEQA